MSKKKTQINTEDTSVGEIIDLETEDIEDAESEATESKEEDSKADETKTDTSKTDEPAAQKTAQDVKSDKKIAEGKKEKSDKKDKIEKEDDSDLYSDEVYKDTDSSDDDMVYLDISGDEVTEISSSEASGKKVKKESHLPKIPVKPEAVLTWLLVVLGAAVYISLTFNNNVWLDEAFTGSLINTDMAGVLERSMADTLPPLYNIILRLTTLAFGYTVPVMKITSAVPMILTLILGATVVRKRFGCPAACIFIIALIAMPNMLFYGVEIRMYSLGFLFATATGIFVNEVIAQPCKKNWILLTLSAVLAGYTHHFAFVTAGFAYLFLFIYACIEQTRFNNERDRDKHPIILTSFFKCVFATFILYLPCMLVTLKQIKSVSGYFSMPEVTGEVFIKYCRYPFTVGFTPLSITLAVLSLLLLVLLCFRKEKTAHDMFAVYCFLIFYGVLLFGTAVSKLMTANIFVDRYLFFALGLLWLSFAAAAGGSKKIIIYVTVIIQIVIGIYSYTDAYSKEYAPGANELISWLNENIREGDCLYTLEDYEELAYCLPFYCNSLTNFEKFEEAAKERNGNNIWVAVMDGYENETMSDLPSGNSGYEYYINEIHDSNFDLEYINVFRFDRYMFKMYRLTQL